jgi:hypothetical protein
MRPVLDTRREGRCLAASWGLGVRRSGGVGSGEKNGLGLNGW